MSEYGEPWKLETGINFRGAPDEERWCAAYDKNRGLLLYDSAKAETGSEILRIQERIVACVNACAGIPTDLLTNNHVVLDLVLGDGGSYAPTYMALGTKDEITRWARDWLVKVSEEGTP